MILAVDTFVLLIIFKGKSFAEKWVDVIARSNRGAGQVVACDVVVAETSSLFPSATAYAGAMRKIGVAFSSINQSAGVRAGRTFREYRRAIEPRKFIDPSF